MYFHWKLHENHATKFTKAVARWLGIKLSMLNHVNNWSRGGKRTHTVYKKIEIRAGTKEFILLMKPWNSIMFDSIFSLLTNK